MKIKDIIELIEIKDPLSAKTIKRVYGKMTLPKIEIEERYLELYEQYLKSISKDIQYSVDCYLKMLADMRFLRLEFLETGKYTNTSFEEVNKHVYSQKDVMDYHMHGLVLAQFLWIDQRHRILFFLEHLTDYIRSGASYLEIGGGHGLYVFGAVNKLDETTSFNIVDISLSSINIMNAILKSNKLKFHHKDIFDFSNEQQFDFITIGEVVEHLEDPLSMLKKLHKILKDSGTVYLTTPVNAPMIDHIFLFNNASEIRNLIEAAGFRIDKEKCVYSDDVDQETGERFKLPMMYAAFIQKNKK